MDRLDAAQVYSGGAAEAVRCASCSVTETSGSWRKGWSVQGGGCANLCNRCGQRWQKSGRAGSLAEFRAVQQERGRRAAPVVAEPKATPPAKRARPAPLSAEPPSLRSRRTLSYTSSSSSGEEREEGQEEEEEELSLRRSPRFGHPPPLLPASKPPPKPPRQLQLQQGANSGQQRGQHAAKQQQQRGRPNGKAAAQAGPFVSYAIQKLASPKGAHRLFWLQNAAGASTLAVVGSDARLTGHFIYASAPGLPPLRCTNGDAVAAWLEAAFGVTEQVADPGLRLPELSTAERKRMLHPTEPAWAAPALPPGQWTDVREESGRLGDGRHLKRFYLLGSGGAEMLAVVGMDSARKDRRYKYVASEALNSLALENTKEVLEYLGFCLGKQPGDPYQPLQSRLPHPIRVEDIASAATCAALLLRTRMQQQQPQPGLADPTDGAGDAAVPAQGRQPGQSAAAAAGSSKGRGGSTAPVAGGKVRPVQSRLMVRGRGEEMPPPPPRSPAAAATAAGGADSDTEPPPEPSTLEVALGPSPAKQLRLKCSLCSSSEHATDECVLSCASPPALVSTGAGSGGARDRGPGAHRTFSMLLDDPSALASPPTAELPWRVGTEGLQFRTGVSDTRPQVQAAFGAKPQLLSWVADCPSDLTVLTFRTWERKLTACISDLPPPIPTSELDVPVGGWRWTPTGEALAILEALSQADVTMQLLQTTHISRAVAELRTHKDEHIAAAAEAIVNKWRAVAVAALQQANAWVRSQ